MTNDKLLAKLYKISEGTILGSERKLLTDLIETIEDEIRTESAQKSGRSNLMKSAKDILKIAKQTGRENLKYTYTSPDGIQYICDCYRLLKLHNPLPLPELPENLPVTDFERIIPSYTDTVELEIPDPGILRAFVRTEKAQGRKAVYDFGLGLPVVNAEFLLTMLEAFPNSTVKAKRTNTEWNHFPLLFYSENDDFGMLLPLNARNLERKKTDL